MTDKLHFQIKEALDRAYEEGIDHSIEVIKKIQSEFPLNHNIFNAIIRAVEAMKKHMAESCR